MESKEVYVVRHVDGGYLFHGGKKRWGKTPEIELAEHFSYAKAQYVINNCIAADQRNQWEIVRDESLPAEPADGLPPEEESVETERSGIKFKDIESAVYVVVLFIIAVLIVSTIRMENRKTEYEQGLTYISDGEYFLAEKKLGRIYSRSPRYKAVAELLNYASAAFNHSVGTYSCVKYCLEQLQNIPEDYSGPFADEIRELGNKAEEEYPALEKEEAERLAKEEEIRQIEQKKKAELAKEEAKRKAAIPYNPPYIGMDAKYINKTSLGEPTEYSNRSYQDSRTRLYVYRKVFYWKSGRAYFTAEVRYEDSEYKNGYVYSIEDRRNEKPFSYSDKWGDSYDVDEYSDPEEFYYWHEDDFVDYEEAEDYFYGY